MLASKGGAPMAQNIYDRPEFFAGYSGMRRSVHGLDGASEWPAVRALLPDLSGKRVVDLGCGFGWFSRFAVSQGAASVLALDISGKMIALAYVEVIARHRISLVCRGASHRRNVYDEKD
jgi:2-polyprenyl-3-methyl-5-hydroxy-6-metoxy-1,4-benzoquinol methylase